MIYALLSKNFVVDTYALFPQTFETEKQTPQTFVAFRMYEPIYIATAIGRRTAGKTKGRRLEGTDVGGKSPLEVNGQKP